MTLPPDSHRRLMEMGLTRGSTFEVVRFAPMGDPIEIRVRGYHLSLRKSEAAGIAVEAHFVTAAAPISAHCPRLSGRVPARSPSPAIPNSGKTTLFNALTGLRQKVGNYPGVTVEKKAGRFSAPTASSMEILDLPGTYSLQARSPDEAIACEVLLGERADTPPPRCHRRRPRRHQSRAQPLSRRSDRRIAPPMVVALNMVDIAEARGLRIDARRLQESLGVPVIATVASEKIGLVDLKQALSHATLPTPIDAAPMPPPSRPRQMTSRLSWRVSTPIAAASPARRPHAPCPARRQPAPRQFPRARRRRRRRSE